MALEGLLISYIDQQMIFIADMQLCNHLPKASSFVFTVIHTFHAVSVLPHASCLIHDSQGEFTQNHIRECG